MNLKFWEYYPRWSLEQSKAGVLYVPVQLKRLEKQLKVRRLAWTDAVTGDPPRTATEPCASEMVIYEALGSLYQDTTEHYAAQYRDHREILSHAKGQWREDILTPCLDEMERKSRMALRDIGADVEKRWQLLRETEDDLERFRETNRINRKPVHFEGRFFKLAVLGSLVVLESALNAFSFGQGNPLGPLGGFAQALMISAASVVFSAGCGLGVRLWRDRLAVLRHIGVGAGVLWLLVIPPLHLTVGHFRDAIVSGIDHPARAAVSQMLSNPLALQSMDSILLVLLGFIAAVVALCEGARLDDPFLGYGQMARQVAKAEADYTAWQDELLAELRAIADEARGRVQDGYEEARLRLESCVDELHEAVNILRRYAGMCRLLASTCIRLVKSFRQKNSAERSDPPPAYFHDPVVPPCQMDENLERELAKAQSDLDAFDPVRALQDLQARIQETERRIDELENFYRDEALALFERLEKGDPDLPPAQNNGFAALKEVGPYESQD